MSTQFRPVQIPPGVVTTPTKNMASSNWSEVNLVRWREGQLTPMGGQSQLTNIVGGVEKYKFASRCRQIHGWYDNNPSGSLYHIAYLCETNLYVDTGGTLTEITPTGGITAPAGLVGGYSDGLYSQNLLLNASVAWTTSATTITLASGSPSILAGQDIYNVTKQADVGVVQSVAGNVVTLTAAALSAGSAGDVLDFDWYGRQRAIPGSVAITKIPDAYSLDNFGSILYAMTSPDGRLLMWDPAVGGAAVVQPAASGRGPVPNGRCFVVTQERFIMIFGSVNDGTAGGTSGGSPRRVAWCDQENPGAWDYSNVTSQAGFLDIEPASPIICAIETRTGVLIWTAKKTYVSQFLGSPYIYNCVEVSDNTTPWSPQSVSTTSSLTLWMAEQGVFSFDGTSVAPVACAVRPWIDDQIDPIQVREIAFSVHVSEYNEWWWFFPTLNSAFNTRAAIYCYKEGWWTQAQMSRSAGITSSYTSHPVMADDYVAFEHEIFQGAAYANASMPVVLPYAETFDLNLLGGSRLITVKQMIPDIGAVGTNDPTLTANAIANLNYSLFYRNSRSLGSPELQSPPRPVRSDGYVDFRTTGRDIRLRIDIASPVIQPFTVGRHLVDAVPRGDR